MARVMIAPDSDQTRGLPRGSETEEYHCLGKVVAVCGEALLNCKFLTWRTEWIIGYLVLVGLSSLCCWGGLNTSCGIDIWNSIEVAYLGFMLHVVRSR